MNRLLLLVMFVMCYTTISYAQPVNDNCANATPILLDEVVSFSTIDATTDGVKHPICLGTNDSIPADVWFTWTALTDGGYSWSNCTSANFDSRIAVYENAVSCPPTDAELVSCNDDGPADCLDNTSTLNFFARAGNVYTFRMGGYSDSPDSTGTTGSGTVVLTALPPGPINDFCSNAIAITLGTEQSFSTINGLVDGPNHPGNSACFGFGYTTIFADIWYVYLAEFTGSVQWNTCDMINFDSRMAVYKPGSACPPLNEDLYDCNDDSGCNGDFHSTLIFDVTEGETYLLRLGGYSDEEGSGTFELIDVIPPDPPVNDQCADAIETAPMTVEEADNFDILVEGSTLYGTNESNFIFPSCSNANPGGEFSDVWFSFNNLGRSSLEIRFFPITPTSLFNVELYESCDIPADSTITGRCFNVQPSTDFIDTLTGLSDIPTTYLLKVTTRLTTETPGDFFFQIVGDDSLISSTQDLASVDQFQIYPNPVEDLLHINFELSEPLAISISVINNIGSVMHETIFRTLPSGSHSEKINLKDFPSGIYFISLSDGVRSKVEKIIKH